MLIFAFKPVPIIGIVETDGNRIAQQIIERVPEYGELPEGCARYFTVFQRQTGLQGPNGPIMDGAEVDLSGDTLEEAFASIPAKMAEWTELSKANVNKAILTMPMNHAQKRAARNGTHFPRISAE